MAGDQDRQMTGGGARIQDGSAGEEAPGSDELAHVSPELRNAIEGGSNASAPDAVTGKLSSEGTGAAGLPATAGGGSPSGGDVGGMGGAGATPPNHDSRPPGGVSPLSNDYKPRD